MNGRIRDVDRATLGWVGGWASILAAGVLLRVLFHADGRVPVDDAFITLRYAWNLAHSGAWYFNAPGEPVQGASSLLWVAVLSMASGWLGPGDPRAVVFLAMLGALLQVGAIVTFTIAAARDAERRLVWTVAALLFAISPTILDQAFNGMESSLAILLIAWIAVSRPGGIPWAAAIGLLALARPETVATVLVPLFAIHAFGGSRGAGPSARRLTRAGLVVVGIGLLALAAVAAVRGGASPLPTTFAAKNATYGLLCGTPPWPDRLATASSLAGFSMASAPAALGIALAMAILFVGLLGVNRTAPSRTLLAWVAAWTATVIFQVIVVRWSFPWYPAIGGSIALIILALALAPSRSTGCRAALVACVVACIAVDAYKVRHVQWNGLGQSLAARPGLASLAEAGTAIRYHGSSDTTVMLEPAGAVAWFSGARILDTIGLVSDRVSKSRSDAKCWYDVAVDRVVPDVIVLREFEIRNNLDFLCGYREPLSCRGTPIPDGYRRLNPPPDQATQLNPVTVLVRERASR